ncbi:hypothetical protein [Oecophyllibacter saccharovorans]|uniref:hypothetical protein n=1 Tax=Oecophyllibacter saccharovorans TaxID=2558360 RepID=UPI001142E57A|nr:hypothetical protein [Oecophyllibacter saccharovorans]QDH15824.1 hypothetical protein E3E11_08130 [Oecophyllibacter saccharovorans]TPW34663.1 hypothetical protein E3203_03690 [Oecophyllibacter saccharovorans]
MNKKRDISAGGPGEGWLMVEEEGRIMWKPNFRAVGTLALGSALIGGVLLASSAWAQLAVPINPTRVDPAWIDSVTHTKLLEYGGNWYCALSQEGRYGCDSMQKAPGLSLFLGKDHTLSVGVLFAFGPGTPHDTQVVSLSFPSGYTLGFHDSPFHVLSSSEIGPFVKALTSNKVVIIHTADGHDWPISLLGIDKAVEATRFYVREHNIPVPSEFMASAHLKPGDRKVSVSVSQ